MLPLVLFVLTPVYAHGETFVDFSLRSPDAKAARLEQRKAQNLEQLKEAEDLEKIQEAEHLEKIHEAERLEQLKAAEDLAKIREAESLEKIHEEERIAQIHGAEHLEQLKEAEDLEKLHVQEERQEETQKAQPAPAYKALLASVSDAFVAGFEYLTGGPTPMPQADLDADDAVTLAVKAKTAAEVQRLDDVERVLEAARKESDDAFANIQNAEADDKGFKSQNLTALESNTKHEVERMGTVEDALRQARDAVTLAINGSESARQEAVAVVQEVKETQQQFTKAKNSRPYDLFRAGISFLLGSLCSRGLPMCIPWLLRKKPASQPLVPLVDPCEDLEGRPEA